MSSSDKTGLHGPGPMIIHQCVSRASRRELPPLDGMERELVVGLLGSLVRPDAVVEEVVAGPLFVAVTAGGRTGMASLLGAQPAEGERDLTERIVGMKAGRAAECMLEPSPFAVCLGLAALNAVSSPSPETLPEDEASAENLIAELGQGKAVGLVGEFPFTVALRKKVGTLHLFELRDIPDAVPGDLWDEVLPGLEVLAVTATALLTRQMGYFLSHAENAVSIVLGPTTPLSQALFRFGADYLCGSVVTDPRPVLAGIRSGLSFRAIKKNGGIKFVKLTKDKKSH